MTLVEILSSCFVYGATGMLLECGFTGFWSLLKGDRRGTCTTYLHMLYIYGIAGLLFGAIHDRVHLDWFFMGPLFTLLIYAQEFAWHLVLERALKVRVWDYGRGSYTLAGRVQPKYLPAWLLVGCSFVPLHVAIQRMFSLVAKYGLN